MGVGTNQENVRRHNLSTLLGHLHLAGQLSRSSLTTLMGLNRSTIADLVGQVELLGLAAQQAPDARGRSAAGRPSVGVAATEHAYVLAVDVRVSGLMVARVGLGGLVLSHATGPSPTGHDPRATVDAIADLVRTVVRDADPESVLVGIGVSVPGIVAGDSQIVRLAPNLDWHDLAFAEMLATQLGTSLAPVLGNDADHGALAEHLRGVGRGVDDLVYVAGEVGVGAGLIAGGRPVNGASGFAGEIGHLPFGDGTRPCHCGAKGCWETEIGAAAMAEAVGCPLDRLTDLGVYLDELESAPAELADRGATSRSRTRGVGEPAQPRDHRAGRVSAVAVSVGRAGCPRRNGCSRTAGAGDTAAHRVAPVGRSVGPHRCFGSGLPGIARRSGRVPVSGAAHR